MTREEATEYLRQYIAARERDTAEFNARRRQAEEDGLEFTEPWEFDGDDNDFQGAFSDDPDTERGMIYDD